MTRPGGKYFIGACGTVSCTVSAVRNSTGIEETYNDLIKGGTKDEWVASYAREIGRCTNGIDNEGFDDISYSIREKPSHSSPHKENNHFQNFPKSDERILLWQFEEPAESFLQTTEDKSGLKSEALASILGAIYILGPSKKNLNNYYSLGD